MKLKRNDFVELRKGGLQALTAKLEELKVQYVQLTSNKLHNELKNVRELAALRRAIAKIKTMMSEVEIKETK